MRKSHDLISLVQAGNAKAVHTALVRGADANVRGEGKWTPLHWAAQEGFADIVRHLIEAGADVNASDTLGFTPLVIAAGAGFEDVAKELLRGGASVNQRIQGNENGTALHLACSWGQSGIVRLLIEVPGIDLNLKDNAGMTPLAYARDAEDHESVRCLLERGAR